MKPTLRLRNFLLASALLTASSPSLQAADYWWNQNGTADGWGGAGTWDTSTTAAFATTSTNDAVAAVTATTTTSDTLNIGTASLGFAGGTITLSGTQNIGSIITGSANSTASTTISGGTAINFAATGTITNNSAQGLTFLSVISGAATRLDINANSTGTVTLAAVTNTYLGTTYINSGNVNVNNNGSLGSGVGSQGTVVAAGARIYFNNNTLAFASTETFNIAGSGVGGTTGALYATSDRDISFDGGVTLSGNATAYADSGTSSFVYKAGINLGSNTMTFHTESSTALQTVQTTKITGNGGIIKSGAGNLTISVASDYTGNTTINGGTLTVASNLITNSPEIFIGNGATVSFSAAPWTMGTNQKITGTGATGFFTSTGTATSGLRMNGGNTISSSGTLTISRLEANGTGNQITGGDIQTGGTTNTIARRGLIIGNANPGELTITGGTVTSNGGTTALADILGVGAGVGSLIINGSAAAYANTGYLDFGNNNGTGGSGTLTVTNGSASIGTLRYNTTATGNAIVNLNGGTLNLGGISLVTATYASRQINFNGGQLVATGSLALDNTFTLNVQNGGAKINTNGNSVSVTGDLVANGTGGLTKSGAGTLTLSGANTYTGATTITGGTLALGASGSIASSAINVGTGATFDVSAAGGFSVSSGKSLGGDGAVTGAVTFSDSSIFAWNVGNTLAVSGNLIDGGSAGGSVFKIVLANDQTFADTFWNTTQTWNDVVTWTGGVANLQTLFNSFSYENGSGTIAPTGQGSFSLSGTNLTWTAVVVPEPTSALAGLLIGAGLLRRRRKILNFKF